MKSNDCSQSIGQIDSCDCEVDSHFEVQKKLPPPKLKNWKISGKEDVLKTNNKNKRYDPTRTRTWNPLIRSQMPYPLGHGAFTEGSFCNAKYCSG